MIFPSTRKLFITEKNINELIDKPVEKKHLEQCMSHLNFDVVSLCRA